MTIFTRRYEIQKELGRGGMATVYLGYDTQFNRQVALKTLPKEFLHDPMFHTRFEKEAKIIASLEHPAIVPVYDFGEANGQPFLVMRYLPGGSMEDMLQKSPTITWIASALKRVALAIDHAHSQGVVHRDLKPGNVLFDADANAYLSDFGIATLFNSSTSLTKGIIGTPAYMSPEQARGEALSPLSDLYSLGAVIFHLLSGRTPYQSDTPMGMAMRHITDSVPAIGQARPELSYLQPFFARAMAKNPTERYQSARELVKDLIAKLPENQRPPSSSPKHQAVSRPEEFSKKRPEAESTNEITPPIRKTNASGVWLWGLGFALFGVAAILLILNNNKQDETNNPISGVSALSADGPSYQAAMERGLSYKHRLEIPNAIIAFDEALAAKPGDSEARYQKLVSLGIEQYRKNNFLDAKNTLDKALQEKPNGPEALCRRGLLELTKDSYGESSETDLQRMFEYQTRALAQLPPNPSTPDEAITLGSVYHLMGRIEHERSKRAAKQRIAAPGERNRAIDYYQKALGAYPNIGAGASDRAIVCANLNKLCSPDPRCTNYLPPWKPSDDEIKAAKKQFKEDFGTTSSNMTHFGSDGRCFIQIGSITYETTYGAPFRQ